MAVAYVFASISSIIDRKNGLKLLESMALNWFFYLLLIFVLILSYTIFRRQYFNIINYNYTRKYVLNDRKDDHIHDWKMIFLAVFWQ